jgi:hypothetical protein
MRIPKESGWKFQPCEALDITHSTGSKSEANSTTLIKTYGECLNKKITAVKYTLPLPQNTPPRFEHTYPIVLDTF